MAFHVACPITCRKICFCALGFPEKLRSEKGRAGFLEEVARVEQFLNDPWLIKSRENATIQVKVPKVVVSQAPPPPPAQFAGAGGEGEGDEAAAGASAQVKRAALQKQAAAASMVAEDYARRFESGDLKDAAGEEQGHSNAKILCRLCFSGENEGSERASKMLSCNGCGKKYHRGCVKVWSRNRDLFHWSSWSCPSCRTCEVCRRTGDPNKFMFCKRCDGAYHCYCQQPPHKNVGQGPYLCPKHTKCHSCGSLVPGNGLSVRWFLGYTCCDACGRLFVKGNYCPVCLKVYRDSESTPMVCCDICQSWVHCPCDGISDEKYMQFQVDGNLQYVCPACRGECSKIRNLEEAVPELWKRRDEADKDLIASLRAAAGFPTQDEIFDISPFSDDEESGALQSKNEYGRTLKFSVKGVGDKSPKRGKEFGKKSSKKPGKKKENEKLSKTNAQQTTRGQDDDMIRHSGGDNKSEKTQFSGEPGTFSPVAGSAVDATAVSKRKHADEVMATSVTKAPRTIRIKSNKSLGSINGEEIKTDSGVPKAAQGPKLVIHLGGRGKNRTSPPRSDTSSFERGQDLTSSNGKKFDQLDQVKGTSKLHDKGIDLIKLKTVKSEVSSITSKHSGGEYTDAYESVSPKNTFSMLGKRRTEDPPSVRSGPESVKLNRYSSTKDAGDGSIAGDSIDDNSSTPSASEAPTKGHRPYLKFKIPKNPNAGSQNISSNLNAGSSNPFPLAAKDDMTCNRGQRSKRRRPALGDEDASQWHEDSAVKDFNDANWVLQKLGKDAAGKRVEIHHPSDDSWHRGTVIGVSERSSTVSISLDDGLTKSFEFGKQGIRFVSQKHKH